MEVSRSLWRSLWSRYGLMSQGHGIRYSILGNTSDDESLHDHDILDEIELKTVPTSPIISWQTEPAFAIIININRLRHLIIPLALVLLPSFIYSDENKKPRKLSRTSYLDGLRGVSSFLVVIHHYSLVWTPSAPQGWHSGAEGIHNWFFQWPMIRLIHSGRFMVTIFFIISGYVLSYRALRLAREGKPIQLLDSLASSVFRRWFRLNLPAIASCFIAFLMTRWSLFTNLPEGWYPAVPYKTGGQPLPARQGTFTAQFWDWYGDTQTLCDPLRYGAIHTSRYNINILWTIPVEWMGSMLVFITVLALARTKTWVKLTALTYIIYWCHHTARWEAATFLTGTLLAELSFIRGDYFKSSEPSSSPFHNEKPPNQTPVTKYIDIASRIFWTLLFTLGLYIGSHPQEGADTSPGYITLMSLIPSQYSSNREIFWLTIGAPLVVFSLENAPFLQRIFTTRFAQYLGDISFSLYMLHTLVLFSLGQSFVPKCLAITGGWRNGQWGFIGGMLLAGTVLVPVTFWAADVFSRVVDERCVRFARWLSEKCFVKG